MENSNIKIKTKICRDCKEEKDIVNFTISKYHKDGFKNECKNCVNIYHRTYNKTPKRSKYKKQNAKEYYSKPEVKKHNKEKCEEYRNSKEGKLIILIGRADRRAKKKQIFFDLDNDWILNEWSIQNGQCPFLKMDFNLLPNNPLSPSIDRIDSSKGYTKDNCRLISWWANAGKNMWSEDIFIEMCRMVAKNFPNKD